MPVRFLAMTGDFREQKGALQDLIEARGYRVLFYSKFYYELNFIEFFWAAVKHYTYENCEYSLDGLRTTVPQGLNCVPSVTIWRFYQKIYRTMLAYHEGMAYGTEEFKNKVYKSYRRVYI